MKFKVVNISAKVLIISVISALAPFVAIAEKSLADLADSAYTKGEYAVAIENYLKVFETQGKSADLLYNLGNAYAKTGDYGHAMLSYLRALDINPSLKEAKNNVAFINAKVVDTNKAELKGKKFDVEPESPKFFTAVKLFITKEHLSNTWAVWAAVAFILFIVAAALYFFCDSVTVKKIGFFSGGALLAISVITLGFSFMAANAAGKIDTGVITEYNVTLKQEPDANSKNIATPLSRGTLLSVLEIDSSQTNSQNKQLWYKVRLNSDFIGWISSDDFETVRK